MPIRTLFKAIPNLISKLKPCMLMSPLSVAQYLDPSRERFDLVVFDEASQIPVPDAIGAIARGDQLIVVGDSRQLPPTAFFGRGNGLEEDAPFSENEVEDLESVLDECLAAQIPELSLKWHYRSQHEDLITFSNYHYYENKLHTFPAADDRGGQLGVSWVHVPGGYFDRGKSRTNQAEAEAVVAEIVRRLKDVDESTRSIGVVTFNVAQKELIEDLLERSRLECPEIEPYFSDEVEERLFVKNLENVQGDERDVIMFSVGYAPDVNGKLSMNFGPLNREGGERRLNVAITRAKQQLVVFSTLRPEQIDLRRTRAVGAQHFRLFLEYAARGAAAINAAATLTPQADFDSTFEKQVHDRLRQRGWDMDLQVGCSGYRIDLAVRHPEAGGRYLCGVECDGASYHSAKTARDRDRLRQSVLESLGWSMLRVWSTDFWHDPDGTIDRIHRSLNELLNESMDVAPMLKGVNAKRVDHENPNADCVQSPSSGVVPPALPTPALPVFCVARAIPPLGEGEAFYDSEASRRIVARINEVVSIEAPLHRKRLASKVASAFGLSRVTARVINRMSELVSASGAWEVDGFVWGNQEQRSTWSSFRVPDRSDDDSMRPVDQIAPEELMAAMVHIVELNAALDRAELVRETANLFGIKRVTSGIRTHLLSVVSALVGSGSACEKEDTIRLV